jgi:hypothetical protein
MTPQQKWNAKNLDKRRVIAARFRANHLEAERERQRLQKKRAYDANPEKARSLKCESSRRVWWRKGRGIHLARMHDWITFFDGLASDSERCIAAHVLVALSSVDPTAQKIVRDPSFDYNYIAHHLESEAA